ncbi:MAG: 2-acylglycerophosphoethanolamine acyltransferase, partial [Alphaproteobacteria bacterium]|nr:2-acylglycerophosphoethanolamine acyltransferase [Alphaproteobacteria bacterium]
LGFIKLIDRAKRFAKIGGEMISLTAVENNAQAICKDEDFKCVAVAAPHPKKGEQIVLVSNKQNLTRKDFVDYAGKNGLSELYVPSILLVKEDFPVFATGKADKVSLKKWAIEQIKE